MYFLNERLSRIQPPSPLLTPERISSVRWRLCFGFIIAPGTYVRLVYTSSLNIGPMDLPCLFNARLELGHVWDVPRLRAFNLQ